MTISIQQYFPVIFHWIVIIQHKMQSFISQFKQILPGFGRCHGWGCPGSALIPPLLDILIYFTAIHV